ncbi:MAG: hypothetical protein KAJ58_00800 [Candidatus Pacebacteria bacterium]|nr:hypothetical protein [Candidatus Paceibacterota bacterium]
MKIEPNYNGFQEFFSENQKNAKEEFKSLNEEFSGIFDEVIKLGVGTNLGAGQKQKGTAITFYLRAAKYLYTSYDLSITGHTEESRILLRNAIELLILGFLISEKDDVYNLWLECYDLRIKNTDKHGNVDMELAKEKRFWVSQIRTGHLKFLEDSKDTSHLYTTWKDFSTRYSHENMYNLAVRIETNDDRTEIYIGDGYDSKTRRMPQNLHLILDIMKDILSFIKKIKQEI